MIAPTSDGLQLSLLQCLFFVWTMTLTLCAAKLPEHDDMSLLLVLLLLQWPLNAAIGQ